MKRFTQEPIAVQVGGQWPRRVTNFEKPFRGGGNLPFLLCCAAALLLVGTSEALAQRFPRASRLDARLAPLPPPEAGARHLPAIGSPREEVAYQVIPPPRDDFEFVAPRPGIERATEPSAQRAEELLGEARAASDLRERVEALEKAVEEQQKEFPHLVRPNTSRTTMSMRGRVQVDYWAFPDSSRGVNLIESGDPDVTPQDRFGIRRLWWGVQGDLLDYMS
jgi:hypothetical protein